MRSLELLFESYDLFELNLFTICEEIATNFIIS
jgi:hypothetical protein